MPSGRVSSLLLLCGAIALAAVAALLPVGATRATATFPAAPVASRAAFPAWAHGGAAERAARSSERAPSALAQHDSNIPSRSNARHALHVIAAAVIATGALLSTAAATARRLRERVGVLPPVPPPRAA